MENFRCAEFLTESPSTSSAPARLGGTPASVSAASRSFASPSSVPTTRHYQAGGQQQQPVLRRRGTKSDIGLRHSSYSDTKLVLGQIPVSSRKRQQPTTDRLNSAQWPSVLPLADRTVHCDDRCLESMFKAQAANPVNANLFLTIQVDVTSHHRQQAIEWLYDVCKEEHCEPDVFLLAVSLVDRFLSVQCIFRNNLQALAGSCLFVSSKVKAPQPLNAERIAYYTDGAVRMDQILQGEVVVLSKLNWDVSTSTALDFLDQVAARYNELHVLFEGCRYAAHRIQLDAKFAFWVPSVQAALCLMFTSIYSGDPDLMQSAENAIVSVLRCDPQILRGYMEPVQNLVSGSSSAAPKQNRSPGRLIVPPTSKESPDTPSCRTPSPRGEPAAAATAEKDLSLANTRSTTSSNTPNQEINDDSGFISSFSSPATVFSASKFGGADSTGSKESSNSSSTSSRQRLKRSTNPQNHETHLSFSRRTSYEYLDNGVVAYCHASEDEFLSSY